MSNILRPASFAIILLIGGLSLILAVVVYIEQQDTADALAHSRTVYADLQGQHAAQGNKLRDAFAAVDRLNAELSTANGHNAAMLSEIASANRTIQDFAAAAAEWETAHAELVDANAEWETAHAELVDANAEWKRDYASLEARNRGLATLSHRHLTSLQSARAQLTELEILRLSSGGTPAGLREERTIVTPHGETRLVITREAPGEGYTMGLLERSVRMIEDAMGEGIPAEAGYVDVRIFSDVQSCDGFGGQFRWTHIVVCHDESDGLEVGYIIAHETAHYYWSGRYHPPWLDEGAAVFLGRLASTPDFKARAAQRLTTGFADCTLVKNIVEFSQLPVPSPDPYGKGEYRACVYSLGTQLFYALYLAVEDEAFQAAFHAFWVNLRDSTVSIRDALRAAFAAHVDADTLADVDRILDEHYGPRQTEK